MSHFTKVRTKMVVRDHIVVALEELGYDFEIGEALKIRGYTGKTAKAQIRVRTKSKFDIGFVEESGGAFSIVADWWGVRGMKKATFEREVSRRYAQVVVKAKLAEQGFDLVSSTEENGETRLLMRRMSADVLN